MFRYYFTNKLYPNLTVIIDDDGKTLKGKKRHHVYNKNVSVKEWDDIPPEEYVVNPWNSVDFKRVSKIW